MPVLGKRVMAFIRQSRFFFAVPSILAILSTFVVAKNYNIMQLFLLMLSFLLIWSFMSSVNNTYDIETDQGSQLMKTQNPIVTGDLSLREAKTLNLALPVMSIIVAAFVGQYWIGLPLITIILVILYDIKPFRLKDRPFGFLIASLGNCLPFLFSYATVASGFIFQPWILYVSASLYTNGILVSRYLPDIELDLKLGIRNFSASYGAEATRRVDIASTIITALILMIGVFRGDLSWIGLPLLLISVTLQLRVLAQGAEALKNPRVFRRFASGFVPNSVSVVLSIVGSAMV